MEAAPHHRKGRKAAPPKWRKGDHNFTLLFSLLPPLSWCCFLPSLLWGGAVFPSFLLAHCGIVLGLTDPSARCAYLIELTTVVSVQ